MTPDAVTSTCSWAFAAAGSIEAAWYLATGHLVPVSEQALKDCSNASFTIAAFDYTIAHGGLPSASAYPSMMRKDACRIDGVPSDVAITGYERVPSFDEAALKKAVTMRPVATAVQADELPVQARHRQIRLSLRLTRLNVQLYASGVFDGTMCEPLRKCSCARSG